MKEDKRPKKGGWAPGNYTNKCVHCGDEFIGDKRAIRCADCAYYEPPNKLGEQNKAVDK